MPATTVAQNTEHLTHTSIVKPPIGNGTPIQAMKTKAYTPLHRAAGTGHYFTVRRLLQEGASLEAIDKNNHTPLHCAAQNGDSIIMNQIGRAHV